MKEILQTLELESSVFPWQRITARKNKIYLGIKQNTLNDAPIFSHWNFITHDIFFFSSSPSPKYTCVPSSHFSPFSLVTSIRMNLGGRPGRLPGPNLLFPRPRPLPLALQNTVCSRLETKRDEFGIPTHFILSFSATVIYPFNSVTMACSK